MHLLEEGAPVFSAPETADAMGVGRNMAKSIGWWLQTLGLARREGRNGPLVITAFGDVIAERDPFMSGLGTWWLVHSAALTSRSDSTLPWFFAHVRPPRLTRAEAVDLLQADMAKGRPKPPSLRSVQREVAVMMQAYAVPVPRAFSDPEDNVGSPFHRLSLLRHVRAADRFEREEPTLTPPEALGAALSALGLNAPCHEIEEGERIDIPVTDPRLARACGMFGRDRESLISLIAEGQTLLGKDLMAVRSLAGERVITVQSARIDTWAELHFDRLGSRSGEAA